MKTLNWGYIQLGLVALAFGGLQVWWMSRTITRRELAGPLSAITSQLMNEEFQMEQKINKILRIIKSKISTQATRVLLLRI